MHKTTTMTAAVLCAGIAVAGGIGAAWAAAATPAAQPTTPRARAEAAYAAMGMVEVYRGEGTPALETLTNITLRGTTLAWDPGQARDVTNLMAPDWGESTFVHLWDRGRGMIRNEWVRPRATGGTRTYTEIFGDEGGYVIGIDVNGAMPRRTIQNAQNQQMHTMSGMRLRAQMREHERINIVIAMRDYPERIRAYPSQTVNGVTYPAVEFRGNHGTYIVMFDTATNLPAIVRTRDFDVMMGDANYDAFLSDWRQVEEFNFKIPFRIEHRLNGLKIFETTITEARANRTLPSDAFNVPFAMRGKAAPIAHVERVPHQWIIRRLGHGFYLDSDELYMDEGNTLSLTDVGPNMSLVTGGSHNTFIVETSDSLIAFDAPGDDGLANKVIAAAAQRYPGKPFRYVVLTHHHIDHVGGLRPYAAQGAAVVVGKGNGAFFRSVLSAPQTLNPHGNRPIAPNVIEVDGKWSVTVGGRTIEAYSIDTPHSSGYLIPYVPDAKLGYVTDLWGPGLPLPEQANPAMVSVVRGVEKAGITPERFAGGHGSVGNYSDLVQLVQRTASAQ